MILRVTRDDYGNDITLTYTDEDGTAINISDASSVTIAFGDYDGSTLVKKTASFVTNGTNGQVKFSFAEGDIDIAGYYDGEIQVNYADGRRTSKSFTLHVLPDL